MTNVNADLLAALKRIAKIGNETPAMGRLAKAQSIAFAAIEVAERSEAERFSDTMGEMARAEREMLQAQTPVVNVQEEAPNG